MKTTDYSHRDWRSTRAMLRERPVLRDRLRILLRRDWSITASGVVFFAVLLLAALS